MCQLRTGYKVEQGKIKMIYSLKGFGTKQRTPIYGVITETVTECAVKILISRTETYPRASLCIPQTRTDVAVTKWLLRMRRQYWWANRATTSTTYPACTPPESNPGVGGKHQGRNQMSTDSLDQTNQNRNMFGATFRNSTTGDGQLKRHTMAYHI